MESRIPGVKRIKQAELKDLPDKFIITSFTELEERGSKNCMVFL